MYWQNHNSKEEEDAEENFEIFQDVPKATSITVI